MRTNIVIDDYLINEAMKATGLTTKKEVVNYALKELVDSRNRLNLSDLKGKIRFADGYDYKKMREGIE